MLPVLYDIFNHALDFPKPHTNVELGSLKTSTFLNLKLFPSPVLNMKPVSERLDAPRRGRACAIALALLVGSCGGAAAEEFKIGGSGAALGTLHLIAEEFTARNPDIRITTVPSLGSGGSIKAVVAGAIGLAATSRPMNESERGLGAVEIEYARTPFVFAVSTKSLVTAITSRELADIYAGRRVTWADGSPVRIVLRPASDIDTEMVKNLSPEIQRGLAAAEARPGLQFSVNDQDAANDLERIPGAIGPSSLALIVSEKRALRALKLDGKEPTPINAASGAYPYYKRLFLVTGAKRSAAVERFVAFVRSPAGRKILAGNGQWIP
jgi:phosphate transport system substrate-binding protein